MIEFVLDVNLLSLIMDTNMYINTKINDKHTAAEMWLRRKLEIEELNLPDYERPLFVKKEKGKSHWQKKVAQYGFAMSCYKYIAP